MTTPTTPIDEVLSSVENHVRNINDLLPGIPDENTEDFLAHLSSADNDLELAAEFLVPDDDIELDINDEEFDEEFPEWDDEESLINPEGDTRYG